MLRDPHRIGFSRKVNEEEKYSVVKVQLLVLCHCERTLRSNPFIKWEGCFGPRKHAEQKHHRNDMRLRARQREQAEAKPFCASKTCKDRADKFVFVFYLQYAVKLN